jgi:DNA-binding protein H-NS
VQPLAAASAAAPFSARRIELPDTDPTDAPALPVVFSRRERAAVLARIGALMENRGITVDDLLAPTAEPESPAAPSVPLPVKYRHPVSGETWDGQGPHPDWLRRALLQEGMRVDELRPPPETE